MQVQNDSSTWRSDLLLLTLVLGSLFFILLGTRPLFVPDEGRYAEIAREMLVSHDYLTPHLNGVYYFEKPALFYWLGAAALKLGGIHITAIRSVNALLGLAGCLLTYLTARTLYNRKVGLTAAFIQGTSLLYFVMAHMVSLDLTITVFMTGCLYCFILSTQATSPLHRRLFLYAATALAALAVLTKGLIGVVFPALIISAWIITTREWRILKQLYLPSCLLIFLAITLPWHLLMALKHPGFFYIYFIEQHILRYTDVSIGHYGPVWFFVPYLIAGFIPWIVFLPQALWQQRHAQYKPTTFFLLWALIIFLFFSFSKSKLIPYILPMFPPLAIVTALATERLRPKTLALIIANTWMAFLVILALAPRLDHRTILPLASQLKPLLQPQDEVVTYNQYYQDLPFYLERRVSILNWRNELSHGMRYQNTQDWLINDATFWQRWHGKNRVFAFLSRDEYQKMLKKHPNETVYLLGESGNNLLVSNCQVLDLVHH